MKKKKNLKLGLGKQTISNMGARQITGGATAGTISFCYCLSRTIVNCATTACTA
jgi:hypothetical protein